MKTNSEVLRDETWDYMVEMGIATENEIGLAVALCGNTLETLERVLFVRTGCRNLAQIEEEGEEERCQRAIYTNRIQKICANCRRRAAFTYK